MDTVVIFLLLHFGHPMKQYLDGVKDYYAPMLEQRHVSFQPVLLKDSTYVLNPGSLDDPNFKEIVDSIKHTTWPDSLMGHKMIIGPDTVKLDTIKSTQFIKAND